MRAKRSRRRADDTGMHARLISPHTRSRSTRLGGFGIRVFIRAVRSLLVLCLRPRLRRGMHQGSYAAEKLGNGNSFALNHSVHDCISSLKHAYRGVHVSTRGHGQKDDHCFAELIPRTVLGGCKLPGIWTPLPGERAYAFTLSLERSLARCASRLRSLQRAGRMRPASSATSAHRHQSSAQAASRYRR